MTGGANRGARARLGGIATIDVTGPLRAASFASSMCTRRRAIDRRIALYNKETAPLLEYYRARGNLVGIHGDRPVNEVFGEIQDALEQLAVRE